MGDYSDSIKSLESDTTSVDISFSAQATVALVDASEVKTLREGTPSSTRVSDTSGEYDPSDQITPDYLAAKTIKVRKYQLKK